MGSGIPVRGPNDFAPITNENNLPEDTTIPVYDEGVTIFPLNGARSPLEVSPLVMDRTPRLQRLKARSLLASMPAKEV